MMYNLKEQPQGFTLIELLLVLVIVSIILYLGIGQYISYRRDANIDIIKQDVSVLSNALNIYYHLNCHQNEDFTQEVSMEKLQAAGLMPNLVKTDLVVTQANGYDYAISAKLLGVTVITNKPIYQLNVTATLNINPNQIAIYQSLLGATSVTGNTLTWGRLPDSANAKLQGTYWMSDVSFRYFKEITTLGDNTCAY